MKHIGSIELQSLTAMRLNAFYSDLSTNGRANGKGGLSPATVRYVHAIIRKASAADAMKETLSRATSRMPARVPRVPRPENPAWNSFTTTGAFPSNCAFARLFGQLPLTADFA